MPDDVVKGMEEQLSGACTTEIAAFDEFTSLLVNDELKARFDHIIFDTAPTGHTIRLLQLPGAWSGFLEAGQGDASCLGPLADLDKQRDQYREAVEALSDPAQDPSGSGCQGTGRYPARGCPHTRGACSHWIARAVPGDQRRAAGE